MSSASRSYKNCLIPPLLTISIHSEYKYLRQRVLCPQGPSSTEPKLYICPLTIHASFCQQKIRAHDQSQSPKVETSGNISKRCYLSLTSSANIKSQSSRECCVRRLSASSPTMNIFGQHLAAIIIRKAVCFTSHPHPSKLSNMQIEAVVTTLIKERIILSFPDKILASLTLFPTNYKAIVHT